MFGKIAKICTNKIALQMTIITGGINKWINHFILVINSQVFCTFWVENYRSVLSVGSVHKCCFVANYSFQILWQN